MIPDRKVWDAWKVERKKERILKDKDLKMYQSKSTLNQERVNGITSFQIIAFSLKSIKVLINIRYW